MTIYEFFGIYEILCRMCVCVCVISFTTIRPWALISLLSQLDAAAPESSYPLGDKPVNQPALFQTLVGHSVIVVRHVLFCSVVLSVNLYSGDLWEFHPPRPLVTDLRNQRHQRPFKVPLWPGDLPCRFALNTASNYSFTDPGGMIG